MIKSEKTYLDAAATSFPKPEAVYDETLAFAREIGIGNDRGHYREGRAVAEVIRRAREGIGRIINAPAENIIFTSGTTESLNTFLFGYLRPVDHVIYSPFEHNAARRPLRYLEKYRGLELTRLTGDIQSGINPDDIARAVSPRTRACVISHISNAFGLVQPVEEIGRILKNYGEIAFVVDGAQSTGTYPVDLEKFGADFFAFSGHKGLLAPTGIGGFYIASHLVEQTQPLKYGGTGSNSAAPICLEQLPARYEVGTQNTWGIAGMAAGTEYVLGETVKEIHARIKTVTEATIKQLLNNSLINLYLPADSEHHSVISFNFADFSPRDTADLLETGFNIKVRDGLHCSPDAHRIAGTFPRGTVRASFGYFNTPADGQRLVDALEEMKNDRMETK